MPTLPCRTLSVSIDRRPEEVYAFVSDPANLPRWSFITSISREGDRWIASSPDGTSEIRFVEANALGVLDHTVRVSPELELYSPMRVIANGTGSEVLFTLFRIESMSDEAFERDAATVKRDLERLKQLLETG